MTEDGKSSSIDNQSGQGTSFPPFLWQTRKNHLPKGETESNFSPSVTYPTGTGKLTSPRTAILTGNGTESKPPIHLTVIAEVAGMTATAFIAVASVIILHFVRRRKRRTNSQKENGSTSPGKFVFLSQWEVLLQFLWRAIHLLSLGYTSGRIFVGLWNFRKRQREFNLKNGKIMRIT